MLLAHGANLNLKVEILTSSLLLFQLLCYYEYYEYVLIILAFIALPISSFKIVIILLLLLLLFTM